MEDSTIDWTLFLGRASEPIDPAIAEEHLLGKRVLITGAAGSIGSALARGLADAGVDRLVLLDISEGGLFDLAADLESERPSETVLIVGDVCDAALLREVFAQHLADIVFHAAACKHVALMETNPFTAARSNILGTHRLLQAANEARAGQVIVISTDKAVDPAGIMGASKRVAELLVLASKGATRVQAVRLANVLGSSGSAGPIFRRQIARGAPLTVTDPACTRYFLAMEEAVRHLVSALAAEPVSSVLVPETGEPSPVLGLAHFVMEQASTGAQIVYTGLRAGEKLTEQMIANDETSVPTNLPHLRRAVAHDPVAASKLVVSLREIESAIQRRDLDQLLGAIIALVPAYQPSRQILQQAECEAKLVL